MTNGRSLLDRTLGQLRRRHVIRVLGGYAVTVWVILQVADIVLPAMGAPEWVMTALLGAALAGAPLAAVLAWVYDLTPAGVVRTPDSDGSAIPIAAGSRAVDYVIIAALLVILAFVLLRPSDSGSAGKLGTSIAVLPFTDLTADESGRYFGDGVAETVMDQLARIDGLRLSARTSSFSFRGTSLDAASVARQLGVETLLEGSVRRDGNQLRISARLIDGARGTEVWSNSFNGTLDQAFALQDQVAGAVARVMELQRTPGALAGLDTGDAEAYDRYLRGRAELRARTGITGIEAAINHFLGALDLDADFGLASAGLCRARWTLYEIKRTEELADSAIEICETTQARYPELVESRIAIASLLLGTGDPAGAEQTIRKVLADRPNNAEAQLTLGLALRDQGQLDAAQVQIRRAIALDPAFWNYRSNLGIVLLMAGELDPAIEALRSAIGLNPGTPLPYNTLGGAYFMRGDFLLAADAFEKSLELEPTPVAYSNAGTNYFFAREFQRAEAMFRRAVELAPEDFRYSGFLAWAIRGQPDRLAEAEPFHRNAISAATRRLVINPHDGEARAALAVHLAALDLDTAANGAIDSLAEYGALNVNALAMIGFAHYYLDQYDQAVRVFRMALDGGLPFFALELDPRLGEAWENPEFRTLIESQRTAQAANKGE